MKINLKLRQASIRGNIKRQTPISVKNPPSMGFFTDNLLRIETNAGLSWKSRE